MRIPRPPLAAGAGSRVGGSRSLRDLRRQPAAGDAKTLSILDRDDHGLGSIFIQNDGWYYVDRRGRAARVLTLDNGPDPFDDGLARFDRHGKIGYLDASLRVVVAPAYDFAWPFRRGRAMVCRRCVVGRRDAEGDATVTGGQWGYIDKRGNPVVPIRYTRSELEQIDAERR